MSQSRVSPKNLSRGITLLRSRSNFGYRDYDSDSDLTKSTPTPTPTPAPTPANVAPTPAGKQTKNTLSKHENIEQIVSYICTGTYVK